MKPFTRFSPWLRRAAIPAAIVLVLAALVAGLAIVPAVAPDLGARMADMLRSVVGVQPVADLESVSNRLRDTVKRDLPHSAQPQIGWAGGAVASDQPHAQVGVPALLRKSGLAAPATNAVTAAPAVGWQAFGPIVDGQPAMARALLLVDPQRSYAGVAIVRMDLSLLSLHIMPGVSEPGHPSGIDAAVPHLGMVPPADQQALVAVFNGGFKVIHGHYGMMVNGLTIVPPIDGLGTVALYKDGSVRIGAWNVTLMPSPDMVAYRQNCPPLITDGQLNPALGTDAAKAWGFTHNTDVTWRSAIGLSQDGRYLIYAVGNGTDTSFLAQALQRAGAYNAMQLDINQYYTRFYTYTETGGKPVGQPLLVQMDTNPAIYLAPTSRDFMYVTTR